EGGLTQVRPGSAARESRFANFGSGSSVYFSEDGVDGAHDRDHVGDLVAGHDMREDGKVGERRAPPLQTVRFRPALPDAVPPALAPGAFDPGVALAFRHAHLRDRLHARPRRDGALRQPVERLADDADRLAELDHPDAVARVAVAGSLYRDDEVEIAVRR